MLLGYWIQETLASLLYLSIHMLGGTGFKRGYIHLSPLAKERKGITLVSSLVVKGIRFIDIDAMLACLCT
jgi:hypothetical protein